MATTQELLKFHSEDYVNFLSRVSPDAGRSVANNLQKFNVGEYTDCPIFDGMMEFCKLYTGCSIGACFASLSLLVLVGGWDGLSLAVLTLPLATRTKSFSFSFSFSFSPNRTDTQQTGRRS
jgi:hypothetical protein